MNINDVITARLRTLVPVAWGALLGVTLPHLGPVSDWLAQVGIDPTAPSVQAGVVALAIAVWDYLWKRAEPHLPHWLTRLVVGSAKTPTYAPTSIDGAPGSAIGPTHDGDAGPDLDTLQRIIDTAREETLTLPGTGDED